MKVNQERCTHPKNKKSKINKLDNYYFCIECGSIILSLSEDNNYNVSKPLSYQQKIEMDPLSLFTNITKKEFKIINSTHPYYKNRSKAISLLQKYSEYYKYSESSFYLALHYMDYIFSHQEKNVPQKKFELFVINSFLLSVKFYEKDIIQPDIPLYTSIGISYDIDEFDINQNEIECLKILKYDLNLLNSYDLLHLFMYNGYVFENEIQNKSKEFSNIIYCYGKKIFSDIILTPIAIQYSPLEICFSIIHLSRKQFGLNNQYFNIVKKLYDVHLTDYKSCLNSIKKFLNNPNKNSNEPIKNKSYQSSKSLVPLLTNKKKENEENEKKEKENKEIINLNVLRRNSLEEEMKTPININKVKKRERIDSSDIEDNKKNFIIERKITATLNFQKHKRASSSSFLNKLELIEEEENIINSNNNSGKTVRLFSIDSNNSVKRSKSKENKIIKEITIKSVDDVDKQTNSISVPNINRKKFKKQRSLF
jgi:hypothetical protein